MPVAITSLFYVTLDAIDVGAWTECSGLSAKYEVEDYVEGGQNAFVHKLPGRLTYSDITLKRPIDEDSGKVASWFASRKQSASRSTAAISAWDDQRGLIATWNLVDVIPISWKGPSLGADSGKVAVEELTLAHHGFI